jgi:hypothetical protein
MFYAVIGTFTTIILAVTKYLRSKKERAGGHFSTANIISANRKPFLDQFISPSGRKYFELYGSFKRKKVQIFTCGRYS